MTRLQAIAIAAAMALSPIATNAAEQTVVLTVTNATCALCAPIVRKTLARIPGVSAVQVAEANADSDAVATVTFDDAKADVAKLIAATTNAGYPSSVKD